MTAENTRLFSNSGRPRALRVGVSSLNGQPIDIYHEANELPGDEEKRGICEQHLAGEVGSELMGEFWIEGCDFDKALEEGIVRTEFSCIGQTAFRKRCRARLKQYDINGNVLNTGKIN